MIPAPCGRLTGKRSAPSVGPVGPERIQLALWGIPSATTGFLTTVQRLEAGRTTRSPPKHRERRVLPRSFTSFRTSTEWRRQSRPP